MDAHSCIACGETFRWKNNREVTCPNPDCPGGGRYVRCGFCGKMSFSISSASNMRCVNPVCTVFDIPRRVCPECAKASCIPWKGESVCINRNCPGNRPRVRECLFCGERSFLDAEGLMFCTKAGCTALLEELKICEACGETSFSVRGGSCRNRNCETFEESESPAVEVEAPKRDEDLARVTALWPRLSPRVRKAIRNLAEHLEDA